MTERSPESHGMALVAGRYELVRELGHDGELVRWLAFDSTLDREVLIELLRPDLLDDAAALERFSQATRSAARASTVAGERVLDGGTDAETGRVFVVRERPQAMRPSTTAETDTRRLDVPPQVRHRASRRPGLRRGLAGLGVLVVVAVGIPVLRPTLEGWLAWVNAPAAQISRGFALGPNPNVGGGSQTPEAARTPAGATPAVGARTVPSAAPTTAVAQRPTATSAEAGVPRRVVNTDGRGVALRSSPGGDRLPGKGYDEGATVTAFERSGEWTRIRGHDGREGWVLSVTLAP